MDIHSSLGRTDRRILIVHVKATPFKKFIIFRQLMLNLDDFQHINMHLSMQNYLEKFDSKF